MNRRFIRKVENEYPYPISIEFRRLNTVEYGNNDFKRLMQILKIAEVAIHFLAVVATVDLLDEKLKVGLNIPDSFSKEFKGRFTRTSFGKWIALLREIVKIFKSNNRIMFIEELADFFIKGKSSESDAQKSFNKLTTMRNKLAHPDRKLTPKEFENLCNEAEDELVLILEELDFIIDYRFLYVNKVSVEYHKRQKPKFEHSFSEIIGLTNEFSSYKEKKEEFLHTPSMIIEKDNNEYINLEPLIIYSDEGNNEIPDVFIYSDWNKNNIKYKASDKGGEFNLIGTKYEDILKEELKLFFSEFGIV